IQREPNGTHRLTSQQSKTNRKGKQKSQSSHSRLIQPLSSSLTLKITDPKKGKWATPTNSYKTNPAIKLTPGKLIHQKLIASRKKNPPLPCHALPSKPPSPSPPSPQSPCTLMKPNITTSPPPHETQQI
ncbi:hypothetical protein KC19_3G024000, partial [Ceratodon purpureus]